MFATIIRRLRRLTYWQWAKVGLAAIVIGLTFEMWGWHRSSMAYRRLTERHPQNSEKVSLVPKWLSLPESKWSWWYTKRPTGFSLNYHRIDDGLLRDLESLPTIRSLMISENDPFGGMQGLPSVPADAPDLSAAVRRIAQLRELESIHFNGPSVSETDLEHLAQLRQLQGLSLCGSKLNDLQALPRFQRLNSLWLSCDSITATGWKHVSQLPNLEQLSLYGMTIRAPDLKHLGPCRKLTSLLLLRTSISSDCWPVIAQLDRLEELHVAVVVIADPEKSQLPQLPRLKKLDLRYTNVSDESLIDLASRCPRLTELILWKAPITDAAIPHLVRIPNLKTLDLRWTSITQTGCDDFARARPNVTLRWEEVRAEASEPPQAVDQPQ